MLEHSHQIINEKAEIIHKLNSNIARQTEANVKLSEMKQLGKREAEQAYEKLI